MTKYRRIQLSRLESAAEKKRSGYLEACKSAGRIDGEFLQIPEADWQRLRKKFRGWGDRLRDFLAPFVRGTRLQNCGSCKRRAAKLNHLGLAFHKAFNRSRR